MNGGTSPRQRLWLDPRTKILLLLLCILGLQWLLSGKLGKMLLAMSEREDRVRADLARRLYRWDPTQSELFDLTINTASFTDAHAADLIVSAFRFAVADFPQAPGIGD